MNFRFALLSLLLLLFFVVGCDDSSTEANNDTNPSASLSFVVGDGSSSLSKAMSGHVTVESAKILLRTIQFHSVNDDDSSEYKTEAVIVDLDLTGGLNTLEVNEIAPGQYNKVSFRLHKPDSSDIVDDTDFFEGDGGNERYSVVVAGLHGTTAFTYKSRSTAKQRIVFDSALVITDTTSSANVTLAVDVDSWFVSNKGDLDPTNPQDENDIDKAIKASFRGFVDNDKRGRKE
jgi:hypothetical protein